MSEQSEVERLTEDFLAGGHSTWKAYTKPRLEALIAAVRAQQSAEVARLRELLISLRPVLAGIEPVALAVKDSYGASQARAMCAAVDAALADPGKGK